MFEKAGEAIPIDPQMVQPYKEPSYGKLGAFVLILSRKQGRLERQQLFIFDFAEYAIMRRMPDHLVVFFCSSCSFATFIVWNGSAYTLRDPEADAAEVLDEEDG